MPAADEANRPSTPAAAGDTTARRIDRIFQTTRQAGRSGLMPFITGGFPRLDLTAPLLREMQAAGATIVEVGIPFSDPIADGPVIAASMHDALVRGVRVSSLFDRVREVRPDLHIGLVAMVSFSIVHRFGLSHFVERAAEAGFDGFIFPDLPLDEAGEATSVAGAAGLTCSLLIAPSTPPDRAAQIAEGSTGFVYLMARMGITGERSDAPQVADRIAAIRATSTLPIACGFGISSPEAVQAVTRHADAAIVGSALVRRLADDHAAGLGDAELIARAGAFVRDLAGGLRSGSASTP